MSVQDLIVFAIVAICLGLVLYRKFRKKKSNNPCDNCPTGCELHTMMMERQKECRSNQKKNNNCCH
jgi:hypothetical protein